MVSENGTFSFVNGTLPKMQTNGISNAKKTANGIWQDDSVLPVKAQTIHEMHSLHGEHSAPTSPVKEGASSGTTFTTISEEELQNLQLQSIRSIVRHSIFKIAIFTLCVTLSSLYTEPSSAVSYNRVLYLTYGIYRFVLSPFGFLLSLILLMVGVSPQDNSQHQCPVFISVEVLTKLTQLVGITIVLIGGSLAVFPLISNSVGVSFA